MAEPLSTGASVLAFVGLALSSAKAIYEVLSAVKDGPQNVKSVADAAKQLGDILDRIAQLQVETIDDADMAKLAALSSHYEADLAEFTSRLKRLHLSQDERRVGRLWKRLKAAITEKELAYMRERIRDHIGVVNTWLTVLTTARISQISLSVTQSSQILDLLLKLQAEFHGSLPSKDSKQPPSDASPQPARSSIAQASDGVDAKLEEVIDRLVLAVKDKKCTVDSDDAEELMADLQTLLDSAREKELQPIPSGTAADMERITSSGTPTDVLKELKLASSLIFSAPSISLNLTGRASPAHPPAEDFTLQQDRKSKVIDIGRGTLTVTTNNRRRVYNRVNDSSHPASRGGKDFTAQILFRSSKSNTLLFISVTQRQLLQGSFSGIPRALHGNIIPEDSYVFEMARNGCVADLMSLLAQRKASLRDRGPGGWSLLHYAIVGDNAPTVKVLIQNGLDVDERGDASENGSAAMREKATPLHLAKWSASLDSVNLLLEAGADPTIYVPQNTSFFYSIYSSYMLPRLGYIPDSDMEDRVRMISSHHRDNFMLELVYKHSQHYGLSTHQEYYGKGPFLETFRFPYPHRTYTGATSLIRRLSFLLSKGCSVSEVDTAGFTCLHTFFRNARRAVEMAAFCGGGEYVRDVLAYGIRQGADVYAADRRGWSVSQFASSETCSRSNEVLGSYCGDLWDAVLDSCGYDIPQLRKGYPRHAAYTASYSRQEFENLWKRREDRSPYWDGADWCSPEDVEYGDGLEVQHETVCVCRSRYGPEICYESTGYGRRVPGDDSESGSGRECKHDCDGWGARFPEETLSEADSFDDEAHLSPYSPNTAPPLDDELSHNPWDGGDS